jgi:enoyl-CoA hydratase/carnithine racemase
LSNRVDIRIDDHVAEVMLNRPDKLNAVDTDMFHALDEAARSVEAEKSIRAVVLHGAGENFCAGIDIAAIQGTEDLGAALLKPVAGSTANIFQRAAYAWRELPVPVICALRGVVFGAGLDILPPDRVKELAWTARVFDAAEALQLGMITAIEDDPLAAARKMARVIRGRSPDAVRGIKRLVNEAWQHSEKDSLALEAQLQLRVLGAPNQAEAVRANLEKRAPDFID